MVNRKFLPRNPYTQLVRRTSAHTGRRDGALAVGLLRPYVERSCGRILVIGRRRAAVEP
jgi:hypothetical protein